MQIARGLCHHAGAWSLLVSVVLASVGVGASWAAGQSACQLVLQDDFGGDGRQDSVVITFTSSGKAGYDRFGLVVDTDTLVEFGEGLHGTAMIVDIDSTDRFREIAIPEWGPSDDDAVHFVRATDAGLRILGTLPGVLGKNMFVDGSGIIRTRRRGAILHTWWYTCEYRMLEDSGALGLVPRDFRVMDSVVRLKRDLPLFASPEHRHVTATICRGEKATIEITDDREWCRIHSESGVRGWFRVRAGVSTGCEEVDPREVFDGLFMAD